MFERPASRNRAKSSSTVLLRSERRRQLFLPAKTASSRSSGEAAPQSNQRRCSRGRHHVIALNHPARCFSDRNAGGNCFFQRKPPALARLVRQPRNQINADVREAGIT